MNRCPFLGLNWDRTSSSLLASPEHRCFADKPVSVSLGRQQAVCLAGGFRECENFSRQERLRQRPAAKSPSHLRYLLALLVPLAAFCAALVVTLTVV